MKETERPLKFRWRDWYTDCHARVPLTSTERAVALYMHGWAKLDSGITTASHGLGSSELGISREAFMKARDRLVEFGLLLPQPANGRWPAWALAIPEEWAE